MCTHWGGMFTIWKPVPSISQACPFDIGWVYEVTTERHHTSYTSTSTPCLRLNRSGMGINRLLLWWFKACFCCKPIHGWRWHLHQHQWWHLVDSDCSPDFYLLEINRLLLWWFKACRCLYWLWRLYPERSRLHQYRSWHLMDSSNCNVVKSIQGNCLLLWWFNACCWHGWRWGHLEKQRWRLLVDLY